MMTHMATPQPNVIYGVTHDLATGERIIRIPRACKVSIGIPAGKAMHTHIQDDGKWVVQVAGQKKLFATMDEARRFWQQAWPSAPESKYPQRLAYFTFRRFGPDGSLQPDWEAIQAHGVKPTVIDVIFDGDAPLSQQMALYGGGRRKCYGDGVNALRAIDMAKTPDEKALADACKAQGLKVFPLADACATRGCPLAEKRECKPHARLSFQLARYVQFGARAEYNTTGYRSITQLNGSLESLRSLLMALTGDAERYLRGVTLQLIAEPYDVQTPDGKRTKQHAVRLMMSNADINGLVERVQRERARMISAGPARPPVRHIAPPEAATVEAVAANVPDDPEPLDATAVEEEFYPAPEEDDIVQQQEDEDFGTPDAKPSTDRAKVAAATERKTSSLRERLAAARQTDEPRRETTPVPPKDHHPPPDGVLQMPTPAGDDTPPPPSPFGETQEELF